jgi:hypothetical protein
VNRSERIVFELWRILGIIGLSFLVNVICNTCRGEP